ncbi:MULTISPECIES: glycosyltransferase family 2 protein [unclassified Adlercreutzia]|uniref:glycosyltransferase family 2 protein n=1 Tax=unclassified Adlercreutzia TaxID=2636013 RepID=UPI0013EC2E7E|nr:MULTISPECIES: glycosyltransferase family 2 protein [unclassified Adlercreutzia]
MKTVSFIVPCYNSAAYMDVCIKSLLECGSDIEIIIVDDGSTDTTSDVADKWAHKLPDIVHAIHKPNGGHGSAVNAGLDAASGLYFKVVDSDDWLDKDAMAPIMDYMRTQMHRECPTDLVVANYVYEKIHEHTRKVMDHRNTYPTDREITWHELGKFSLFQYLHMHAVIYRTQLLKDIGLKLPEHCFYVDNLYVYIPLPHVRSIRYFDCDMYRYYIGREGQSVGVEAMLERIDQHLSVTRTMIDSVHLPDDAPDPKLFHYMSNHMAMMICVCAIFLRMRNTVEDDKKLADMWDYLHFHSPELFKRVKRHPLVIGSNIPTTIGRKAGIWGYNIGRKMFNFN